MEEQTMNVTTRRHFLRESSALVGASLLPYASLVQADPPPEVRKLRLINIPAICHAPQYVAEAMLKLEGFTELEYLDYPTAGPDGIAAGRVDLSMWGAPESIPLIDEGKPIVFLSGLHAGCWEVFGNERVRQIQDLKGKSVVVTGAGSGEHIFISSMLAYVGIDPSRDVKWVTAPSYPESMHYFADGKADAFLAFPPIAQEARAKRIGHVVLDTSRDKPWSQYFCCMVTTNREFLTKHPVATKRALRAILKSADICAAEPERVAKFLVEKGYESRYEVALEVLKALPYNRWRENSPDDTLRFHALRLREVGMIKSSPQEIVSRGTDVRFLNELRRELKA
jgi:NitT/TauT family transport system substrate-binding protein